MTQEEKQLILKDLNARLPYRVRFKDECYENLQEIHYIRDEDVYTRTYPHLPYWIETIKPYLRPMSSMTEEEDARRCAFLDDIEGGIDGAIPNYIDWLNKNMFDYRGLIEKGLALEAPEGMYNLDKK